MKLLYWGWQVCRYLWAVTFALIVVEVLFIVTGFRSITLTGLVVTGAIFPMLWATRKPDAQMQGRYLRDTLERNGVYMGHAHSDVQTLFETEKKIIRLHLPHEEWERKEEVPDAVGLTVILESGVEYLVTCAHVPDSETGSDRAYAGSLALTLEDVHEARFKFGVVIPGAVVDIQLLDD